MKTILYYFTGTGNSLALAEKLQKLLPESIVYPIIENGVITKIDQTADIIGLIFPVYIWAVPPIVERFVNENNFPTQTYIFGLTNFGGSSAYTLPYLNKLLNNKQTKLSAGFGIKMPGNYTPFYGALTVEKQQKFFNRADEQLLLISKIVKQKQNTALPTTFGPIGWFITMVLYKKVVRLKVAGMDKNFYADQNCIGCGKCAKVCPVKNVLIEKNRPVWLHKCEQCFACLQVCPVSALQAGKMTKGRKRYSYPGYDFKGHNR